MFLSDIKKKHWKTKTSQRSISMHQPMKAHKVFGLGPHFKLLQVSWSKYPSWERNSQLACIVQIFVFSRLHICLCVPPGYSDFLPLSKEIQCKLICDSKSSVGMSASLWTTDKFRVYLGCCPATAARSGMLRVKPCYRYSVDDVFSCYWHSAVRYVPSFY